jgi:hypothetical protein
LFAYNKTYAQVYYPAGMSNTNLSTWLDASDASTITITQANTGAQTTVGTIARVFAPASMPTSKDITGIVPVGSQIQVGSDVYTVTATSSGSLTVTPNLVRNYTNQTINRLGVSKWADKSGVSGRDLISPVPLVNFTSTETTSANEPSYIASGTASPAISFMNGGTNATAQYLQGTGTAPYGITTNRSLAFVTQINSYNNSGTGGDGQGTYLFDRNPDPAGGTSLFSIKFESNTITEQIRDDAGNLANNPSTISSPASGTMLNMSLVRSGVTDQFYNNGNTAGSGSVSTGISTMQPLSITYHAGDDNNDALPHNLNMFEIILTNNTLSTTYRQLEEGYLAWKWGTAGSLGSAHPYKNVGKPGFTNDLVGIGRVSATDSVAATRSMDGLGFMAGTGFLQDNGDYLTAIDNNADGTEDGSFVTSGNITRLNRVWYIQKTDVATHTGGTVTLYFDYSMLGNGVLPGSNIGSYSLIFHSTNYTFPTGSTTIATTATAIVGSQIQFTLNATALNNGYYTLKTCSESSVFDYPGSPFCTSGSASITLLTGGGIGATAGTFSISPAVNGNNNFKANSGKINDLSLVTPGTYTVTNTVNVGGGSSSCTSSSTCSLVIAPAGQWVGGVSSDWNTAGNWPCGSIPVSTSTITIPSSATNYPVIGTGAAFVKDITIQNGAMLTINNETLSVFGTITSNSAIDATNGTIQMRGGAAQTIGGSKLFSKTINNLIDSNTTTSGLTISDSLYVTGLLGFATGPTTKLTTGNVLVLVSNAATTAGVGQIAETGAGVPKATITGNVTAQRYFPAHRRWRLITSPLASSQTINAAWQEGVVSVTGVSNPNPHPGYGIHISGPTVGAYQSGVGYDQTPSNSASIATVTAPSAWYSLVNTNATAVTAYHGYMIFVRGGRDYNIATSAQSIVASNATLRTVGTVRTGLQNTATVTGFNVIGNPYPATINFNTIYNNSGTKKTANTFYLWDPNIASAVNVASGTGGWVTLTSNGIGGYIATIPSAIANGGFDINGNIQSGAAFLVNATGVGNIAIDESAKVTSSGITGETYLFRPSGDSVVTSSSSEVSLLSTTLYAVTADSTHTPVYVADGLINLFGNEFSNDVNWDEDAQKATNTNENISIAKAGQLISIEKSAPANFGDTIALKMAGMKSSPYQFSFTALHFNRPDLTAVLVDSTTNTSTPIKLGDSVTTTINFAVTSAPATSAANRFYILFKPAPGSVKYSSVTATQQAKNIVVQWIVTDQLNINKYVVEKSINGVDFYPVDTTIATSSSSYNWLDVNAVVGDNYYRIRSIDNTGAIAYSQKAEAVIGKGIISGMAIYPNPVINGTLQLQLNNMPAGEYVANIISTTGQILLTQTIDHGAASETKSINISKGLASGVYILEIIQPDKTITNINFENQH